MRFVSHSPNFHIQVVEEKAHPGTFGDKIIDREGYVAVFNFDLTAADLEFAERVLVPEGINGRTYEIDEVTPAPLMQRLSVFDTDERALSEGWAARTVTDKFNVTHDFKEYVEKFLSERALNHPDFRQIYAAPVTPPWPNYLEFDGTLEELVDKVVADGYSLTEALTYERTLNRPAVIEAYEQRLAQIAKELESSQVVNA